MLKEIAIKYIQSGLNIIPANGSKAPFYGYDEKGVKKNGKPYQEKYWEEENYVYFDTYPMISIICGAISGNLECLDFDVKWQADCYDVFMTELVNSYPEIVEKLVIESTPSGGYHIYYRCQEIEGGNKKLAGRLQETLKVYFIEKKSEGGLITCTPSPNYSIVQGDLTAIQTITTEERMILLLIAINQNTILQDTSKPNYTKTTFTNTNSPFAKYNQEGKNHALDLLLQNGFTKRKVMGNKVLLTHPQSKRPEPNSIYDGALYIWGNCTDFEPEKRHSPCDIFIKYIAGGDKSKAASILKANGY